MSISFLFEIDWSNAGAWVDESDNVLSARLRIGMAAGASLDDLVAQVGTCRLTLDNSTRRYSPDDASGPLYGDLLPRRPVRVRASDGVSTWSLFRGYVERIEPQAGPQGRRQAVIDCVDALALLRDVRISMGLQRDRRADQLIAGAVNLAFGAPAASGTITFTANPAHGDTVTIDGQTYTFRTSLASAYDVKIGAAKEDTAASLRRAINSEGVVGTDYAGGTERLGSVVASLVGAVLTVNASLPGAAGNAIALARSCAGIVLGPTQAVTISGGTASNLNVGTVAIPTAQGHALHLPPGRISQVSVWHATRVGSPSGLMKVLLTDTLPSGTLLGTYYYTPVDGAENVIGLPDLPLVPASGQVCVLVVPNAWPDPGNYWVLEAYQPSADSDPLSYVYTATIPPGGWNAATDRDLHIAAVVEAVSLSGGVDYPPGLIDYRTGNESLAIAADRWTTDRTAALDAIRDIVRTEQGRFFVQRDGTLTFYDRRWFFTPLTPALSLAADPFTTQVGLDAEQVYNLVNVTVHPRATAGAVDVLARSTSVIRIPPLSASGPGTRTITLYFRDGAGNVVGGTGLVLPLVAGTDFSVNDRADGTGFDYTSSPAFAIGPLDVRGSEVRITFYNDAIGPLYVTKLQVRGQAVTVYDPVTQSREDAASQSTYLKRMLTLDLSLSADEVFGEALAYYLLDRFKAPFTAVRQVTLPSTPVIGGVNVFSLDLFDVFALTDSQTGVSAIQCYVTGIDLDITAAAFTLTLHAARADDRVYWNLGVVGYGELGTNTRLAV